MVYHQNQEQMTEHTIQDNNANDNVRGVATTSQQEPPSLLTNTTEPTPTPAPQPQPQPQEELGRNFASRRIQVATLAIRSSHSASQSPLFLQHDMYRLYQQPFIASSLSTPTINPRVNHSTSSTNCLQFTGEMGTLARSSLPSHLLSPSTILDPKDRALFDKTLSVLAPKSESNQQQQQQKKARRRVTFNDNLQFFPPPPIDYDDPPKFPSSSSLPTTSSPTDKMNHHHQGIEKDNLVSDSGNSMSPPPPPLPQYSGYWAEQYTNTSTENTTSFPEPPQMAVIPPKHQASKPVSSVSSASSASSSSSSSSSTSTSSSSSSSSSSSLSLSLSSSSTQTNSINNNGSTNDTNTSMIGRRSSLFFNQRLNTSTASLPAYQPISSSNVYNVTPASVSTASLISPPPSSSINANQMALQRKGNKISRHAILDILENRAPHTSKLGPNHRRSVRDSKRLSSLQQTPNGVNHTLDSVQHEIRQAIARAQASNVGKQLPQITNSPALVPPSPPSETNDTSEQMSEETQVGNVRTSMTEEEETEVNTAPHLPDTPADITTEIINDINNQPSSGDDSSDSSTTIPGGEDNKEESIHLYGHEHGNDSFTQVWNIDNVTSVISTIQDIPSQDMVITSTDGDQESEDDNRTMNDLLVYLPSSDDTLSNFGDTLLSEFDRITGDLMEIENSDSAAGEMQHPVPPYTATQSCSNSPIGQAPDDEETITDILPQSSNPNMPWRILGPQNDASAHQGQDQQLNGQQSQNAATNGRLYIKIIAAENLDFPINQGAPSIQCSVNDGSHYLGSGHYKMQHNIHFNHEFILNNMAPDGEFTLTLHAIRPGEQTDTTTAKRWPRRSSFTNKHDDLARYISPQDGALAQTRVSLKSVSYQCRTKLCTASFALVNGWYQPAKKSSNHHPLFLSKAQKGKRNIPVQEKAVGKITIELFYLPNADDQIPDLPADMDSCENALNIQRFHQTVWRYGYMSQLGGDVKFWRRRYFKLIGGHLYSNTDTAQSPRTMIDLSKAVAIASDNRIILDAKINNNNHKKPHTRNGFDNDIGQDLLSELESQVNLENQPYHQPAHTGSRHTVGSMAALSSASTLPVMEDPKEHDDDGDDDDLSSYSVKNSFQLKFDNGDKIEFFCDSTYERERWLDVLKVILGRIPTLPSWLSV